MPSFLRSGRREGLEGITDLCGLPHLLTNDLPFACLVFFDGREQSRALSRWVNDRCGIHTSDILPRPRQSQRSAYLYTNAFLRFLRFDSEKSAVSDADQHRLTD